MNIPLDDSTYLPSIFHFHLSPGHIRALHQALVIPEKAQEKLPPTQAPKKNRCIPKTVITTSYAFIVQK